MLDFTFRRFQNNKTTQLRRAAFLATVALSAALLSGCQTTPDTYTATSTEADKPAKSLVNSIQIPSDESQSGDATKTDAAKADAGKSDKASMETTAANLNTKMKDGSNNTAYVPPKIKGPIQMPVFADANDPAKLADKVKQYTAEIGPILDKAQRERDVETIENAGASPSATTVNKTGSRTNAVPAETATSNGSPDDSKVEWMQPGKRGSGTGSAQPAKAVIEATPGSANAGSTVAISLPNPNTSSSPKPMTVTPGDLNNTVKLPIGNKSYNPTEAEAKLTRHIQEHPRDLWAHLDYQLTQFIRDERVPQYEPLTPLPTEDRELIASVMDGLTLFRNGLRADNNTLLSKKVKPLLEMGDRLRAQAELNIPTLSLCTKVDGFGVYEPIEPARFIAGREHQAIVYCEVENFASNPLADRKEFETKLSQEASLFTENGMLVWADKAGTVIDKSRNRRHDFFIVKKIKLPSTLTIGRYLLKVSVEDLQAHRVAEQNLSIEVVAQIETQGNNTPIQSNLNFHGNKDGVSREREFGGNKDGANRERDFGGNKDFTGFKDFTGNKE